MLSSMLQKAGQVMTGAWDTIKTMVATKDSKNQQKKMLKSLLQNATNKAYTKQTGQQYTGPEDSFPTPDKPTEQWQKLYGQSQNKYKNLK